MIQANELRIGNIVMAMGNDSPDLTQTVITLEHFGWQWEEGGFFELAEPIPLTPEILKKCGFELSKGKLSLKFYKNPKKGRIVNLYKVSDGYRYLNTRGVGPSPHINYLHQLQNLYFALTGYELEIHL